MKRIITIFISVAIFVCLLFYIVDIGKIPVILQKVNWYLVVVASILGLATSILGPFRLKELLRIIGGEVDKLYIWNLANIGALLSLIFPLSAGGFAMSYFLKKKINTTYKKTFFIVFVDAFFSLPLLLALGVIACVYFFNKNLLTIEIMAKNMFLITVLAIFGILVIFLQKRDFINRIRELLAKAVTLLSNSKGSFDKPILITLLLFVVGNLQMYLYFIAFGLNLSILDFILAESLLSLLGTLPSVIPMKIGQYETFGVLTLPYLLNVDETIIFSVLLLQRSLSIVIVLILGLISLNSLNFNWELFRKIPVYRNSGTTSKKEDR
ncbi:hypothetical protein A2715_02620 [Candidatus Woesebacteria bacterium RIFCSPHIGHO2_01_FULL_39_32]|uniref:Flippase-like domain-containing protein n=1 Tax=Candidatus Woesebacteria bacterium RIFCSPLOWO2_01_FULL_39_25 TaxID=1802521 RepID=A0A1F8BKA8_9BACT|nr:MAG: hypothetical protein A2715_02620 [Candidatus Woesebacteria bacterium RIFCSPHIGHO2_01_FULL_39_32]OGM38046.1 MAG: hypothetical protein A3F01_05935 [Candidatus Woesebacteria bacterium RIFCSPHIGHO2_12_FULL_38_11]OGM64390.1 MAG: hypothetical protein A2893_00795 [Candidatus Woesebacteria bacterium RIFCSPLOWO2_01_FULL_39_25]